MHLFNSVFSGVNLLICAQEPWEVERERNDLHFLDHSVENRAQALEPDASSTNYLTYVMFRAFLFGQFDGACDTALGAVR